MLEFSIALRHNVNELLFGRNMKGGKETFHDFIPGIIAIYANFSMLMKNGINSYMHGSFVVIVQGNW